MAQKGIYKKANDRWSMGRTLCKQGRAKQNRFLNSLEKENAKKHPRKKKKVIKRSDHKHLYKKYAVKYVCELSGNTYYRIFDICQICNKTIMEYYTYRFNELPEGIEIKIDI